MGGGGKHSHPECYLAASAVSAAVNYPLWKASAMAQSGFEVQAKSTIGRYINAMMPPYRGMAAVITGMTWARAGIFYGSDEGRRKLEDAGAPEWVAVAFPPVILSSLVQIINMPIVRVSITMQNPKYYDNPHFRSTWSALKYIAKEKSIGGLWHGLSAGIAKTVPKYVTSVVVKDILEETLPRSESEAGFIIRAAVKSVVAGVAGAALTNPMDVVRNEMFKTDKGLMQTISGLRESHKGWAWVTRGLSANLVAVSVPITLTIFITDVLVRWREGEEDEE